MSAFLVGNKTINAIVQGAIEEGIITTQEANKVGKKLLRANLYSLKVRYGDPMTIKETVNSYSFTKNYEKTSDHQVIQACHCLDYQSCEYDSWRKSEACKIVDAVEEAKLKKLKLTVDEWYRVRDRIESEGTRLFWGD